MIATVGDRPFGLQASQLAAVARGAHDTDRTGGTVTLQSLGPVHARRRRIDTASDRQDPSARRHDQSETAGDRTRPRREEAPEVCDWFGFSTPTSGAIAKNGRSLLPLLRNETAALRAAISLQDCDGNAALWTRNYLMIERDAIGRFQKRGASCHADADESFTQLCLKPEDVWEINNIAEQNPEQIAEMRGLLDVNRQIKHSDLP